MDDSATRWRTDPGDAAVGVCNQRPCVERVDIAPAFRSVYCPGGCGHRTVAPGATFEAFIAYEAFADADKVASSAERVLHYPLLVHACP